MSDEGTTIQRQKCAKKGWLKPCKNCLIPACILVVGLIVAFFFYQLAVYPKTLLLSETGNTGAEAKALSEPVQNGQVFEQKIEWGEASKGVGPRISLHYFDKETVSVYGRILDVATGEELYTMAETFPQAEDEMRLPLPLSGELSANSPVILQFWVKGLSDDATLRFYLEAEGAEATVEGTPLGASLSLAFYTTSEFLTPYYWCIAVPLVLLLAAAWILAFVVKIKFHNLFLLAAGVLGVLFMFVLPPYSIYDEASHIQSTLYYSARLTGDQPANSKHLYRRAEDNITGFMNLAPKRDQYYYIWSHLFDKADSGEMVKSEKFSPLGQPAQYFFPAVGVTLARAIGLGQVGTLYLGGLFQLAVYIAILYLAIRLTPFKALFAMLGILPFMLGSAGSYLYDVPLNALSFLLAGYVFYLVFTKPKMRWWDIALLAVIALLVVPMKYAYMPLVLLPLLIPKEKWPRQISKKVFCIVLILAAVAAVGVLIGSDLLSKLKVGAISIGGGEVYSFGALFHFPREFPRLFLATFIDQMGLVLRAGEFSLILQMPEWLHFVMAMLLLLAVFPARDQSIHILQKWQKGWMVGIAVLVYILILFAALLWTPVGSYHIAGLQSRYLIPVLPLIVLLAQGLLRRKRENDRVLMYGMGCVSGFSILYLFIQTAHNQITV